MKINKPSRAGSLESNDILVMMYPSEKKEINIDSVVKAQFGDRILEVIEETLKEMGVENVKCDVQDKGALDFTIKARVKCAVLRSQEV